MGLSTRGKQQELVMNEFKNNGPQPLRVIHIVYEIVNHLDSLLAGTLTDCSKRMVNYTVIWKTVYLREKTVVA